MNINQVMGLSPYLEVAIRHTYWHSEPLVKVVTRRREAARKRHEQPAARIEAVAENLARRGVRHGDILIAHSAFRAVSAGKQSPEHVNTVLKNLVGADGTIVLPAIPQIKGAPESIERLRVDVKNLVLDYDPKTTPAWTGVLPNVMMKMPGAVRSRHPLNSIVAMGPAADAMMAHELEGDRPMPCGSGSTWNYCRLHHAKVVALGVDMAHSLTMIHVAEDVKGDEWCVADWWRDRRYRIKSADGGWAEHVVRERHPKWALHYGERTLSKDLQREGIMTVHTVEGIQVSLLDSFELIEYLNSRNSRGYPYYLLALRTELR